MVRRRVPAATSLYFLCVGPLRRPSSPHANYLVPWRPRSRSRTAPCASTHRKSYETASFATRSLSSTRTQANTAWAFAKNAEGSTKLFDTLATATLVLGAKSGGDLTKAGFTPQELVRASAPEKQDVGAHTHARRPTWRGRTRVRTTWMAPYCGSSGTPWSRCNAARTRHFSLGIIARDLALFTPSSRRGHGDNVASMA